LGVSFPAARSLTLLSLGNPLLSLRRAHPGGRDASVRNRRRAAALWQPDFMTGGAGKPLFV
jgi:hypothetical protein